ncbi:D-erythrulose-4-phosphate isomerase 1 [Fusarium oxysporum f. sp. albedinis]|nr:D-erythrulose-4-phosphate isomerase 1 [Fusarium oxysporum f. sp. albedinis]
MAITRSSRKLSSRSSLTQGELCHIHNGPSANAISTDMRQQQLPAMPTTSAVDPSQVKSRPVQNSDLSQRHKRSFKPISKHLPKYLIVDLKDLNAASVRRSVESKRKAALAIAATQTLNFYIKHSGNMTTDDRPKLCEHEIIQRLYEIVLRRTGGKEFTGMRASMMVRKAEC